VLNGAQGVSEIMNQVIGQAGPALALAKQALGTNGAASVRTGRPAGTDGSAAPVEPT
jgi:flotillin